MDRSEYFEHTLARLETHSTMPSEGCWTLALALDKDGYAAFWFDGRQQRAHRVAWEMFKGPVPPGKHVCHRCDNPPCWRPDHLFLGDAKANQADRAAKGRRAGGPRLGEQHHNAKLRQVQVDEIRQRYKGGYRLGPSYATLGKEYGVDWSVIRDIIKGRLWKL